MRDIEFRGKARSGKWVIGNLVISAPQKGSLSDRDYYIFPIEEEGMYIVDPKTVGEYTGLKDKNGAKIFEGDIVKNQYESAGKIVFENVAFKIAKWSCGQFSDSICVWQSQIEVIGNIHDNPKLLEASNGE